MIRLENVLKISSRRLEDVLKSSWRRMAKTNILVWPRRLEDVLKMSSEDVRLKRTYLSWSRCLLKTKMKDVFKTSSSRRMFAGIVLFVLRKSPIVLFFCLMLFYMVLWMVIWILIQYLCAFQLCICNVGVVLFSFNG